MSTQVGFCRAVLSVCMFCELFRSGGRFIGVERNRFERRAGRQGPDGIVVKVVGGSTRFQHTHASRKTQCAAVFRRSTILSRTACTCIAAPATTSRSAVRRWFSKSDIPTAPANCSRIYPTAAFCACACSEVELHHHSQKRNHDLCARISHQENCPTSHFTDARQFDLGISQYQRPGHHADYELANDG